MKKPNLLFKFIRRKEPEASGNRSRKYESRVHPANETPTLSNLPTPKTNNDGGPGHILLELPVPSTSSHWLAARSVAASSQGIKKRTDAGEDGTDIPPSEGIPSKPDEIQGGERDEAVPGPSKTSTSADVARTIKMNRDKPTSGLDEDAIKVKKRRLAQRQRRLNPQRPLNPLHNQHPFIRIQMEGDDAQATESRTTRFKAVRRCVCGIVSKCLITSKDTRNCVRDGWKTLMRKKAKWDAWNPSKNHPFVQWINESKIAGLKEAVKPNRGILYRIFWLTTFILLFGGGMKFSIDTYHFHQNSPILFGFKTKEIPIEDIPFPTVTVSSLNSFKPSTVQNVHSLFWDTSDNEHEGTGYNDTDGIPWTTNEAAALAYYMDHICSSTSAITNIFNSSIVGLRPFRQIPYSHYLDITDNGETLRNKLALYMRKVSLKCEDMFRFCVWNLQTDGECKNYFRSVLTSHGGGCSFNHLPGDILHRNKSSLRSTWERGNPQPWKFGDWEKWSSGSYVVEENKSANESFPARQRFGGRPWGLSFILKMEENGDCPQFDSSGSRITISVPGTDFDVAKLNVVVPPNSEAFIELTPELTTADEELRTITPKQRGCYFPDEKPLAFYNKYTQENCHLECLANFTLSECKCTLLSFPNSAGQLLCNKKAVQCARQMEAKLYGDEANHRCKACLPSCNQMTLKKEVTFVPLSKKFQSNSPFKSSKDSTDSSSIVHMFYGPSSVVAKERILRHSKYELFSQIGSIFETTNDVTVVGTTRTVASLYVFYPTLWSLLKLITVFILHGLKKWRSCLIICFRIRRRVTVHNAPAPPMRLVNVIEVEDEQQLPNVAPQVNYEVFLARTY